MQRAHGSQKDYKMHVKRKIPYIPYEIKKLKINITKCKLNSILTKIVQIY